MRGKSFIIATLAALGLGVGQTARATASPATQQARQQQAAIKNGTTTRQLEADHFGGYAGDIMRALMRDNGHTPYQWSTSRQCAQMRRKNRMRAMDIRGSRI